MRGVSSVVCVVVVVAVVAANQHQKELKEHYDHLAYIAEYNCHKPQPRVISVHELFPEKDTHNKAFFPDVTVLHRCDNAVGCCPSNHVCRPKHTHPLHLPFKVTFLEQMSKQKKGSWIIDYHTFDNHTECECVDASVCVPVTEQHEEVVHIGSSHKPEHHGESTHHEPNHHSESSHKTESHHHSESTHHEPNHHSESSHKTESHHEPDHHSESTHHEPNHYSESSHKTESHHEPDHHSESTHHEPNHHSESNHKTEYHTESSHKTEQQSSSYNPDQLSSGSSTGTDYISIRSSSASPEVSPTDNKEESATLPLIVDYILSSTTTSKPDNIDEKDLSSFFD